MSAESIAVEHVAVSPTVERVISGPRLRNICKGIAQQAVALPNTDYTYRLAKHDNRMIEENTRAVDRNTKLIDENVFDSYFNEAWSDNSLDQKNRACTRSLCREISRCKHEIRQIKTTRAVADDIEAERDERFINAYIGYLKGGN